MSSWILLTCNCRWTIEYSLDTLRNLYFTSVVKWNIWNTHVSNGNDNKIELKYFSIISVKQMSKTLHQRFITTWSLLKVMCCSTKWSMKPLLINSYHLTDICICGLCGLSSQVNLISEYFEILDQLGALSTNSLPSGYICTCHLCWEGLPWTTQCGWDNQCLLWTSKPDGKVWSSPWQVHGMLSAVSRWCCTQRCQCCHCHHQD